MRLLLMTIPPSRTFRYACTSRALATSQTRSLSSHHSIYVSNSVNPYFNLTLEDWLFKHKSHKEPLLLLYRDDPCVVIGRNQNPWKEVNFPALQRADIPFVRRRSGGGTVYHDSGNTNFSIHLPRSQFDRNSTGQVVLRAVRALRIDAHLNDRNDLCVGPYKISSAYKIVKDRAYHHGTMLISSQLNTLGDVLHSTKGSMVTKGVASVRSPVRNLNEFRPDISHEDFVDALTRAFREQYGVDEPVYTVQGDTDDMNVDEIHSGMAELPSWDWAFGQTPEFTYPIRSQFAWGSVAAAIRSKHGVILSCTLTTDDTTLSKNLDKLGVALEGQKYGSVRSDLLDSEEQRLRDVAVWLEREMRS